MDEFLKSFNLPLEYSDEIRGPNTKKIYLKIIKPFKLNRILSLEKELGLFFGVGDKVIVSLEDSYIVIEMPIDREFPKKKLEKTKDKDLTVIIGKAYNEDIKLKLAKMPHLIIAGTTGSGKSVLLRNIMKQLENYDFVDGKTTELKDANEILNYYVDLMDSRYKSFTEYEKCLRMQPGACDIDYYNTHNKHKVKKHVIIIDEYADLVMQDKALGRKRYNLENKVIRLMQKARAAGIHVILTTQRPDAKILNGLIRANAPGRIALKTANRLESRIVLDEGGAEKLLGAGDMIIKYPGYERRCQGYGDII